MKSLYESILDSDKQAFEKLKDYAIFAEFISKFVEVFKIVKVVDTSAFAVRVESDLKEYEELKDFFKDIKKKLNSRTIKGIDIVWKLGSDRYYGPYIRCIIKCENGFETHYSIWPMKNDNFEIFFDQNESYIVDMIKANIK